MEHTKKCQKHFLNAPQKRKISEKMEKKKLSLCLKYIEKNSSYFQRKRNFLFTKNAYPTAIIRAKKNDQVVAIPPNK